MSEVKKEEKLGHWMVRVCDEYQDEYSNCKSFKDRFHQYFIYGEYQDCTPWKKDYENCIKWKKNKDEKALDEIIESEIERRRQRLTPHYDNDVWTKRDKPPENWDAPLPEWMQEQNKHSYLNYKNQEDKGLSPSERKSSCTIS